MQEIDKPEDLIGDVLQAINYVFTGCPTIIVKLLTSQKGDRQQLLHTDYVPNDSTITMKNLNHFHYSALISIEQDTKLVIGSSLEVVDIPLHSMLFFRGDMVHAGAAYELGNHRIFLSASSEPFPVTDDVSLQL